MLQLQQEALGRTRERHHRQTMRVCPKCKYVDPAQWRHLRFSYWVDFCTFEDFQQLKSELAKRLLDGEKLVEDELCVYRLSGRKGYPRMVHRKAKIDYGEQFSIPMEHVNPNANDTRKFWDLKNLGKKQRKLTKFQE